jgi:hypothetical protein
MRMIWLLPFILLCLPSTGDADIIIFKSGSAKVGIIEDEQPDQVTFRDHDRVVTIMRSNIDRVERVSKEENENLRAKWKREKQEQEEQRRKRIEAEKKFEEEQKAKGLINVNGRWISAGEAEKQRQQQIQQQIKNQQKNAQAEQESEEPEVELPDYFDQLDSAQQEVVLDELKRQQELQVGSLQVTSIKSGEATVKGTVTNGSEMTASSIDIIVQCYGENDELLGSEDAVVVSVRPGESGYFYVPIGVDAQLIKRTDARIVSVRWQ